MSTYDQEMLEALRARKVDGYQFVQLGEAPTHVPGCDDHGNRFTWYRIIEPNGETAGYLHFPEPVDL